MSPRTCKNQRKHDGDTRREGDSTSADVSTTATANPQPAFVDMHNFVLHVICTSSVYLAIGASRVHTVRCLL